jgi:hypothetical protein
MPEARVELAAPGGFLSSHGGFPAQDTINNHPPLAPITPGPSGHLRTAVIWGFSGCFRPIQAQFGHRAAARRRPFDPARKKPRSGDPLEYRPSIGLEDQDLRELRGSP